MQSSVADKELCKELRDDILASEDAEMMTGSWNFINRKDALTIIPYTAKSNIVLQHRKNLLDTANIILTSADSIMNVSFVIIIKKDISQQLQALLKRKPALSRSKSTPFIKPAITFYLLGSNKFELFIDGFFQVAGKFMKAELR